MTSGVSPRDPGGLGRLGGQGGYLFLITDVLWNSYEF